MANNIKIPIALSKATNKLVNVKDVPNGLACNCYCASCKTDLIAVNMEVKQKAHFRHSSDSNCEHNNYYESYIHWLTKEVFKEIDKVQLPPIRVLNLREGSDSYVKFMTEIKTFFEANNLKSESANYGAFYNIMLQQKSEIGIKNVKTEESFQSQYGNIIVDIVVTIEKQHLFIEPFFTSKIDDFKFKKLVNLNVSVISIDLMNYVKGNKFLFTIEDFRNFLVNDMDSKCWEYVRRERVEALTRMFFNKLDKVIKEHKTVIQKNKDSTKAIEEMKKRKIELMKEIYKIDKEIDKRDKSIIDFPFEKLIQLD